MTHPRSAVAMLASLALTMVAPDPAHAQTFVRAITGSGAETIGFAQGVADLGNRVQELRAQADGEIGTTIARVNTLTARIAELNVPIQHATLGGNSSPRRAARDGL